MKTQIIITGMVISLAILPGCASLGEFITANSEVVGQGVGLFFKKKENKIFGPKEQVRYMFLPKYAW